MEFLVLLFFVYFFNVLGIKYQCFWGLNVNASGSVLSVCTKDQILICPHINYLRKEKNQTNGTLKTDPNKHSKFEKKEEENIEGRLQSYQQ